jgi:hypothetical protein
MSVQNDSNDFIFFFIWYGEGVPFFTFYQSTSYPFLKIISSPISIDRFSSFIYSISSVHTHLFLFSFHSSVFVFVLCFFKSLSSCVVSDVYRSLCMCDCMNYMSCLRLIFLSSVSFSTYGCC